MKKKPVAYAQSILYNHSPLAHSIILPLDPSQLTTAQQKGAYIGKHDHRVHFFTKKSVAQSEKVLLSLLTPLKARLTPIAPRAPLAISVLFFFSHTSSLPVRECVPLAPHIVRPDADNLLKGVLDAVVRASLIPDDAQVFLLTSAKFRTASNPRIVLTITDCSLSPFEAIVSPSQAIPCPLVPLADLVALKAPQPPSLSPFPSST